MSQQNPRQRIRRQESRINGKGKSVMFDVEEHSVLGDDGNIFSRERRNIPTLQGKIPHDPTDVAGQCQTCMSMTTKLVDCQLCWRVVCMPCASLASKQIVCPSCVRYLHRRKWINIFRKLFIDPFVERVG